MNTGRVILVRLQGLKGLKEQAIIFLHPNQCLDPGMLLLGDVAVAASNSTDNAKYY